VRGHTHAHTRTATQTHMHCTLLLLHATSCAVTCLYITVTYTVLLTFTPLYTTSQLITHLSSPPILSTPLHCSSPISLHPQSSLGLAQQFVRYPNVSRSLSHYYAGLETGDLQSVGLMVTKVRQGWRLRQREGDGGRLREREG
jgi:hypothetical protein